MNGQPLGQTQILLIKASEDEVSLRLEGQPIAVAGFHAQQAVEKLMKALLSQLSVPFELTHDLGRLATALKAAGELLPATPLALSDLTGYAILYRYEVLFEFAMPERDDLIDTVRLIREHVLARISALSA